MRKHTMHVLAAVWITLCGAVKLQGVGGKKNAQTASDTAWVVSATTCGTGASARPQWV